MVTSEGMNTVVIGPECFADEGETVICWRGRNYYLPDKGPQSGAVFRVDGLMEGWAAKIHQISVDKGFWAQGDAERNFGEVLALMHSELSEALEEHRKGKPNFYLIETVDSQGNTGLKPEGVAVELIDCVIRIFDTLHTLDLGDRTIDGILAMKVAYNSTRPHLHGAKY